MNTHDKYELPPLPEWLGWPVTVSEMPAADIKEAMQDYALSAIEAYAKRIAELESQLEAIGAGGVTQGQRLIETDRKRRGEPSGLAEVWRINADEAEAYGQSDRADTLRECAAEVERLAAPQPAESSRGEPVAWENFPGYLIDKCEGETITEEGLQRALADMLADPYYAPQPAEPVKVPSDADIDDLWDLHEDSRSFARALLARYGQTAP